MISQCDCLKISVIIPVFNAENSIRCCVESVISQTYNDWELLLIDDGSQDDSGILCDQYAKIDKRIIAYHKENGGVSSARNYGLSKARGEWVVFIDSDDYVGHKYLEDLIKCANTRTDNILVIQGMIQEYVNSSVLLKFNDLIYEKNSIIDGLLQNNLFTFGAPYCKLYNKKVLKKHNILFPVEYDYGEDTIFFLRYIQHIDTLILSSSCNYHYKTSNYGSLSQKCHPFNQLKAYLEDYVDSLQNINKQYSYKLDLLKLNRSSIKGLLKRMIRDSYLLSSKKEEFREAYYQIRRSIVQYRCYQISIVALILLICPMCMINIILRFRKFSA